MSFRTAGAVINRVVENSPAASAGLQNGDIVTQVNQKPVQQILAQPVITFQNGRNDIIGLMNGKTTLTVLTGTRTRNVDVIGAFHDNSDGKSRQVTTTDIPFSIETKADYVLIHVFFDLVPGVYYFEFQRDESIGVGENQPNNSDSSSAPRTDNLHTDKWIFQVH